MRNVAALALVCALGSLAIGCKKSKPDADSSASTATAEPPAPPAPSQRPAHTGHPHATAANPPANPPAAPASTGAPAPAHSGPAGGPALGEKIDIPQAGVMFNAPGGWKKNMTASGWALFKAPDNHARLGYVVFSHPGEATSRLGQLAETFELSNLVWGTPKEGFVGRDHFPDHEGDTTSCTLKNGEPCEMRYMTINPGGSQQIMVVYLVNIARGEALRGHATASVASLRHLQ